MAVSFVTRFRRHLATVPFVIVFLIPVGIAGLYLLEQSRERPDPIAPLNLEITAEPVCLDADPLAKTLDACPEPVQGGE